MLNSKALSALKKLLSEFKLFLIEFTSFLIYVLHLQFIRIENRKGVFVTALYRQRGKLANRLIHSGMAGLAALGVMIAPVVAQEFPGRNINPWEIESPSSVLSASTENPEIQTMIDETRGRDKVIEYTVAEGDTVSSIAEKFGISSDTIRWQNDLKSKDSIKLGQILEILPATGIMHKVAKGETIETIAKKYDADSQGIVQYPFNTFANDETFELAIGQTIFVPEGVKQEEVLWQPVARVRQVTPDAGTVVASGNFVWPTNGSITTRFAWWHKAIDIANRSLPPVLAADSGRVIVSGWSTVGYGNHIIIDHGNGFRTLYAHLSRIYVTVGQSVARGNSIGQVGSTGRSTGPHLHFEVIQNGVRINPLGILR